MKVPPGGSSRRCQARGLISGSHILFRFPWRGVWTFLSGEVGREGRADGRGKLGLQSQRFRSSGGLAGLRSRRWTSGSWCRVLRRVDPVLPRAQGGVQLVSRIVELWV